MSLIRPRGSEKWRIEEQEDGTHDVYLGRHRRKSGVDWTDAVRYVRGLFTDGQKVVSVETDGYETNIARHMRR